MSAADYGVTAGLLSLIVGSSVWGARRQQRKIDRDMLVSRIARKEAKAQTPTAELIAEAEGFAERQLRREQIIERCKLEGRPAPFRYYVRVHKGHRVPKRGRRKPTPQRSLPT